MQRVKKCFEEYGADYIGTMERFLNNEALYVRLLGKLFPNEELRRLGAAMEAGDQDGAFKAAHTLKGVAGNLGLTPLYETLCAIVERLRAKEEWAEYPALYQAVQMEFRRAEEFWTVLKRLTE